MTRDTRRNVDNEIEDLKDDLGTDRSESWRRFISGDLDSNDEYHSLWLTAGRSFVSRAEARQWIRWFNGLDAETQEQVEQASTAGASIPAEMDRDEIERVKDAADAEREQGEDAKPETIEEAAAAKIREIERERAREQEDSER